MTERAEFWRASALSALALGAVLSCGRASSAGDPSAQASSGLAKAAADPWHGAILPAVELIDTRAGRLSTRDLLGKPLVMDFIFTSCAGPCPALSANMRALKDDVAELDVQLVSVSVDPELDTPERLAEYAQRFGADGRRWRFFGASEAGLQDLMGALHLALERAPDGQQSPGFDVTHSTRFVVIDAAGRVRGYYDGESKEGREQARARLAYLATRGRDAQHERDTRSDQ